MGKYVQLWYSEDNYKYGIKIGHYDFVLYHL